MHSFVSERGYTFIFVIVGNGPHLEADHLNQSISQSNLPIDRQIDQSIDQLMEQSIDQSIDQLTNWLIDQTIEWLIDTNWWTDRPILTNHQSTNLPIIDELINQPTDRLTDQSINLPIDRLIDRPINQLINWSTNQPLDPPINLYCIVLQTHTSYWPWCHGDDLVGL